METETKMNSIAIRNAVNNAFNKRIQETTRRRDVVYPRAIYYKLAQDYSGESLVSIGKAVDKDHATVIHGLKLFENVINPLWEKDYHKKYLKLQEQMDTKMRLQVKRLDPDRFYRDKYRIKLLQNKEMYKFTRDCLNKMDLMGHKFTDILRKQLDNIVDDKQFSNDN